MSSRFLILNISYFSLSQKHIIINHFYKADKDTQLLPKDESYYAARVLRLNQGDEILCFNGEGIIQKCEILKIDSNQTIIEILETTTLKSPRDHKIHIAIAPTKQMERTEWFLEKCVEIGVDQISFIKTRHSVRDVIKKDRIDKTLLAAARQSGNFILPLWNDIQDLHSFIHQFLHVEDKFVAHLNEADSCVFTDIPKNKKEYLVLIGPEGDFSEEEVKLVSEVGFKSLSLGKSRLRTETAGIVACLYFNLL